MQPAKSRTRSILYIGIALSAVLGATLISGQLATHPEIIALFQSLGYAGVYLAAVIAGLNALLPIPAATLSPVFFEAGLTAEVVILTLALGTLTADLIGYALGHNGRSLLEKKYPNIIGATNYISTTSPWLLTLFVCAYASFVPLPNEIIVIPLALAGTPLRLLIPPLVIGAIVNQTLLVTGASFITSITT